MKLFFLRWLPVIVWCGFIFFLSSQPHLPGPEDQTLDFILKKIGHVTVYAILFYVVYRAMCHPERSRGIVLLYSSLFCVLYAISDEYHQSFVPGRTPMLRDVGIDMVGMLVSFCILR